MGLRSGEFSGRGYVLLTITWLSLLPPALMLQHAGTTIAHLQIAPATLGEVAVGGCFHIIPRS